MICPKCPYVPPLEAQKCPSGLVFHQGKRKNSSNHYNILRLFFPSLWVHFMYDRMDVFVIWPKPYCSKLTLAVTASTVTEISLQQAVPFLFLGQYAICIGGLLAKTVIVGVGAYQNIRCHVTQLSLYLLISTNIPLISFSLCRVHRIRLSLRKYFYLILNLALILPGLNHLSSTFSGFI